MGSFDGADVCELVGLLALSKLNKKCDNNKSIGLYRDGGLAAIRHVGPRSGDRIRKMFCEVFGTLGLKIKAQANLHVVWIICHSCMNNMESIVKQHNARILKPTDVNNNNTQCNCRKKAQCPLNGTCLTPSIVYQATVTPRNRMPRICIGMTEHDFKTQYRNRNLSFNNRRYSGSSTLSKFVWVQYKTFNWVSNC